MGFLNKNEYSKRRENAYKRYISNSENDSLTSEQHEAIQHLCTARHNLHSNKKSVIIDDYEGLKQDIINANVGIKISGLTPMSFVGTDTIDYVDIDSLNELDIEDEEEYDDNYIRISGELEELNTKIEKYLANIDKTYNTNYCPSGKQRIF